MRCYNIAIAIAAAIAEDTPHRTAAQRESCAERKELWLHVCALNGILVFFCRYRMLYVDVCVYVYMRVVYMTEGSSGCLFKCTTYVYYSVYVCMYVGTNSSWIQDWSSRSWAWECAAPWQLHDHMTTTTDQFISLFRIHTHTYIHTVHTYIHTVGIVYFLFQV